MGGEGKSVRDLQRAIRDVRIAHAERNDVVVELRETERTRLDLLAEALDGVFDDLPEEQDEFALAVLPGNPPRFWVDATGFVMMARDKRTYRFLKDTRLGRKVILENANVEVIADRVTHYVAERIVEREQALEADWLTERRAVVSAALGETPAVHADLRAILWALFGFGLGIVAGAFLVFVYTLVKTG